MSELISIIVPVYNVENYVGKCLQSLVEQTYENIEIIVIDDGSKDGSGIICDEFAEKYKKIKVVHTKNGGLSAARNEGMRQAAGKYIGFVDSDDWVEKDMFEILYELLVHNKTELSVCGLQDEFQEKSNLKRTMQYDSKIADKKETFQLIIDNEQFYGYVCNKLFLRDKIVGLEFDEKLLSCEDNDFSVKYAAGIEKVAYTTEKLYHYRHHAQSMTGDLKYNVRKLSVLDAYEHMMPIYEVYCPEYLYKLQRNYLKIALNIKGRIYLSKIEDAVVSVRLENIISKYYSKTLRNSNIEIGTKINIIISRYFSGQVLWIKQKILNLKNRNR